MTHSLSSWLRWECVLWGPSCVFISLAFVPPWALHLITHYSCVTTSFTHTDISHSRSVCVGAEVHMCVCVCCRGWSVYFSPGVSVWERLLSYCMTMNRFIYLFLVRDNNARWQIPVMTSQANIQDANGLIVSCCAFWGKSADLEK